MLVSGHVHGSLRNLQKCQINLNKSDYKSCGQFSIVADPLEVKCFLCGIGHSQVMLKRQNSLLDKKGKEEKTREEMESIRRVNLLLNIMVTGKQGDKGQVKIGVQQLVTSLSYVRSLLPIALTITITIRTTMIMLTKNINKQINFIWQKCI